MYHHFRGFLVAKSPTHVVVDCAGVGYFLHISLTTYGAVSALPTDGSCEVFLYAHAVYREDAQVLYGFSTPDERDVFLFKVSKRDCAEGDCDDNVEHGPNWAKNPRWRSPLWLY